jgi:hypothetical protein
MLKIITVATKSDYYFPYLKESVKRNGGELVVLGYNEEWTGFNLKYSLMINYLKTLNKKEIVVFVDGYDVICCRNLQELSNEFIKLKNKYDCKIIVGEDKMNNIIAKNFIYNFYGGTCKDKFLNSGTYIGYVNDILNVIENIYKQTNSNTSDDQILMKNYCRLNPDEFYIDDKSELFLTINKPYTEIDNMVHIKDGKLYYNNVEPFFIHAPGGTYLDNILVKLGYDINNGNIKEKLKNDFYKKYALYLSPDFYDKYLNNNIYITLFIFIIIIIFIVIIIMFFIIFFSNKKYKINKKIKK